MGLEETDVFIALRPREQWTRKFEEKDKPKDQWRTVRTQAELMDQIKDELENVPGMVFKASQPIEQRVNEMIAGTKGAVAGKGFGDDFGEVQEITGRIENILK